MVNCMNAINKYGVLEITSAEDILSGIQIGEVATIGSTMRVIQDLFGFIMGEAMTQYGVYTAVVQDITDKEILRGLVSYAMRIFAT